MDYYKAALELHEQHKGKIEVTAKVPVKTRDDLSAAYTPGVPSPAGDRQRPGGRLYYTAKGNLVAVVTNARRCWGWAISARRRPCPSWRAKPSV